MPLKFERRIVAIPCDLENGAKEIEVSLSVDHDDEKPKRVCSRARLDLGFEALGNSPQTAMLDLSKKLKELSMVVATYIEEQKNRD